MESLGVHQSQHEWALKLRCIKHIGRWRYPIILCCFGVDEQQNLLCSVLIIVGETNSKIMKRQKKTEKDSLVWAHHFCSSTSDILWLDCNLVILEHWNSCLQTDHKAFVLQLLWFDFNSFNIFVLLDVRHIVVGSLSNSRQNNSSSSCVHFTIFRRLCQAPLNIVVRTWKTHPLQGCSLAPLQAVMTYSHHSGQTLCCEKGLTTG